MCVRVASPMMKGVHWIIVLSKNAIVAVACVTNAVIIAATARKSYVVVAVIIATRHVGLHVPDVLQVASIALEVCALYARTIRHVGTALIRESLITAFVKNKM